MAGEQLTTTTAKRVAEVAQGLASKASVIPLKLVHRGLCALLLLWILFSLFNLVSSFFTPEAATPEVQVPSQVAAQAQSAVDVDRLQGLHLFGQAGDSSKAPVAVAPVEDDVTANAAKTRLNLVLEGVVYSPDDASSVAVIVHQGKQDQYHIGDKLPVGSRVVLARVMLDRVILDNAGRYESLWLYDKDKLSASAARPVSRPASPPQQVTDKRKDTGVTGMATDYRDRLYKNPRSLAQVLRIAPAQQNGEMVGYRVSPGKDHEQFTRMGFQTNDIVTSVNGIELDEPSKALELYKLMRTASEASFTVERGGDSVEVLVSLDEGADE